MVLSSLMVGREQRETLRHPTWSRCRIQMVLPWSSRSPNLSTQFAYRYAINAQVSVPTATTIELFAGSTPVGNISFTGVPDPTFTGGFAGVASDTPFDRAILTFSDVGDAFAVDNVTFAANRASDEGQTLILLSAGVSVLLFLRTPKRSAKHRFISSFS